MTPEDKQKIAPCPFCGGKADDIGGNECYITCKKCIVGNTVFIEKWNNAMPEESAIITEAGLRKAVTDWFDVQPPYDPSVGMTYKLDDRQVEYIQTFVEELAQAIRDNPDEYAMPEEESDWDTKLDATAEVLTKFINDFHPLAGKGWTLDEFVKGFLIPMKTQGVCLCPVCAEGLDQQELK